MKKPMKGQIIEVEGRKYRYRGGDPGNNASYDDVTDTSQTKDIGLSTLSGAAQGAMDLGQSMATPITKMAGPAGMVMDYAMQKYRSMIPQWQALTTGGKYAGAASRGAVSSLPLGGMGALSGATAGMGGEAGSDLTGGSRWGRLLGSVLGGIAPNVPGIVGGLSARRIKTATEGMTPDDWNAAIAAQEEARRQGIQLTGPEAIGQKAPDLLSKQLLVEQHPKSAGIMSPLMEGRPAQVRGAVQGRLSQTGEAVADPALLGARVQEAAKKAIDQQRQAGNLAARPSYQIAEQQRIPASEWNTLTSNPIVQDALTKVKKNPYYGIAPEEQAGSIRWLDAAKKYLDDTGETFKRGGQGYAALRAGETAKDIRNVADAASPDYATARSLVERNLRENVEPRQLSATGSLAETRDPMAQFGRLTDPALSRPGVVSQVARDLKMTDPTAYRQMVRTGLENEFDQAMKQLASGGQQYGGARFVRQLRATDQTRANIEMLIKELPDGPVLLKGWNNLLDTLEKTGNRLPVGSRTAFNQLQAADMTSAGLLRQGLSAQPLNWLERIEQNISARNMAKLFSDPDSVKKMKELAITKPDSAKARAVVSAIFGAQAED
jgi:hypothetical protein